MNVDWSREFDRQLDRLEGDETDRGRQTFDLFAFMLKRLRALDQIPDEDSAMIKRVRQSRKNQVWRVSHPYVEGIALRLICWFPPNDDQIVVALFAGDKAGMGDVFYDTVGTRADQAIERWLEETSS